MGACDLGALDELVLACQGKGDRSGKDGGGNEPKKDTAQERRIWLGAIAGGERSPLILGAITGGKRIPSIWDVGHED